MSELDNLLDSTLDDLEDLPSFEPYPAGAHRVLASLNFKEINDKQCITLDFSLLESVELSNPQDTAPAENSTANVLFMLDNEYGRGNLKKCCLPFQVALGTNTIRETVEAVNDVECMIVTALRADKNDPDRKYLNIKEIAVI